MLSRSDFQDLRRGLLFLTPNILGVLAFVVFPVVFSLVMAFTNWDLKLHNAFKTGPDAQIEMVGVRNFAELACDGQFALYLWNTLFLMAAITLSVVPMVIVFVLLQRQLVAGIQLGAVKG